MNVPFVDLKSQYLSIKPEVDTAIAKILSETSFIGGSQIKEFEIAFAKMLGVRNCIGVGNGTDAIYIAMKMLGIKEGDEVITTAHSWISTSETISQTGATPIFVDTDEHFTIDFELIQSKITPRTKAIIPVHLYGHSAEIKKIQTLCKEHKLFLIEDCAQSHFTKEKDKVVGTFGDAATFSFYPGKNLGAYGDAGAIVTNDDELATKMRMYANHGALKKHEHQIEGINSRLDTIQAAILNAKLPHILKWTDQRIENAAYYTARLKGVKGIEVPTVRSGTVHTFHLYVIRTKKRDALKSYLESKGVQTAIHYPTALPNLVAYKRLGHSPSEFPRASANQSEILSLPMYPELSKVQMDYVCQCIIDFFGSK